MALRYLRVFYYATLLVVFAYEALKPDCNFYFLTYTEENSIYIANL